MAPTINISDKDFERATKILELAKIDCSPQKIITNIIKSDYVQIPYQHYAIAIGETDFNLDYHETHKAVLKRGLYVPKPKEFMDFHNHIIYCYKNEKPIFDAAGNKISDKVKKDLYKRLTSDCWSWLNGKFKISDAKNSIEYITDLDSNNNLLTRTEDLEDCLMEDCYVDFEILNSQGLPTRKYSKQNYVKEDNIYFWYPRNGQVARFYAYSGGAILVCDRDPSDRYSSLGVFALVEGVK